MNIAPFNCANSSRILVFHGDSSELLHNQTVKPDSIDLTVTSPPYDNLRSYGSLFDLGKVVAGLWKVTKEGGCVIWVVGDSTINGSETGTSFRQALEFKNQGWLINDTMIFLKKNPVPLVSKVRYMPRFEYIFCFSKGKPKTFNPLMEKCSYAGYDMNISETRSRNLDAKQSYRYGKKNRIVVKPEKVHYNVFEYAIGQNRTDHPATFPMGLAEDMIKSFSAPGDVVLDCFAGSGTTGVAAVSLDRKAIMIDSEEKYCEMMKKRFCLM